MFNISFGEIFIIATIGLIIIGPERLPETARFIGHLLSRLQRQAATVKADVRREMELEDMKSIQREYQDATKELKKSFESPAQELNQVAADATKAITPSSSTSEKTAKSSDVGTASSENTDTAQSADTKLPRE
ncbi:Sec-independent protein translocase protein TatB [Candidatus Persebacteraceae bacterium Df01]|jgi:sec-independent protein translocase protein TatB|uniref:Sec-independent protein translocase protein TatB n=1 Tax=Candidatus Doriopsillibacter californiensis TaxID=2970740 RepID=A0ABT7QJI6_9GAMM|nr:Sec-independent protein translocase protein TatB [Candidatus Persebacteraceae bacterium Df01]